VRSAVLILQPASHEAGTFVGLSHVRHVDNGRVIRVQTLRGYIGSRGQPSKQPAGPSTAIQAVHGPSFAEMQ